MWRFVSPFLPVLLLASALSAPAAAAKGDYILYAGSYTDAPSTSKGIYAWRFSAANGTFAPLGMAAQTVNPAYVEATPDGRTLYAVNWQTANSKTGDTVSAYRINRKTGALAFLGTAESGGGLPNEVTVDPTGKIAMVSNYGARGLDVQQNNSGIAALRIESDGKLGKKPFFVEHYPGAGVPGPGQAASDGAHTHGVIFSKDGHYAFVAELGLDRIYSYSIDAAKASVKAVSPHYVTFDPGSGPRREALSPSGKFLYLLRQNDAKVSVLSVDGGNLKEIQKIATVPANNKKTDYTAEIQIDSAGRHLYASNRGPDSIAVYEINPVTGMLASRGFVPSLGKSPRNILIDPTGKYFLSANQDSNTIAVFKIDAKTGQLSPTEQILQTPQPASMAFVGAE